MSGNAQPPASLQFFKLEQVEDVELWGHHRYTRHELGPKFGGGTIVQDFGFDKMMRCKITFRVGPTAWLEEVGYVTHSDAIWLLQEFADHQRIRGRRPGIAV